MKQKVILVFGDSLSDIGRMDRSYLGRFLNTTGVAGQLTGSGGRFSAGPNWTDFMIEETSGYSVLGDSRASADASSEPHRSLSLKSLIKIPPAATQGEDKSYFYANYAKGGACVTSGRKYWGGFGSNTGGGFTGNNILDTFTKQVDLFKNNFMQFLAELNSIPRTVVNPMHASTDTSEESKPKYLQDDFDSNIDLDFVIFIWFGANDVYTCSKTPIQIENTVNKYKEILDGLVAHLSNYKLRLVMMNLPGPSAGAKNAIPLAQQKRKIKQFWPGWDEIVAREPHQRSQAKKRELKNGVFRNNSSDYYKFKKAEAAWWVLEKKQRVLRENAQLFNRCVSDRFAGFAHLTPVDVCSIFDRANIDNVAAIWGMIPLAQTNMANVPMMMSANVQSIGASSITSDDAREINEIFMTSSDQSHPSAEAYEIMWSVIKNYMMLQTDIAFGKLEPVTRP